MPKSVTLKGLLSVNASAGALDSITAKLKNISPALPQQQATEGFSVLGMITRTTLINQSEGGFLTVVENEPVPSNTAFVLASMGGWAIGYGQASFNGNVLHFTESHDQPYGRGMAFVELAELRDPVPPSTDKTAIVHITGQFQCGIQRPDWYAVIIWHLLLMGQV